MVARDTRRSGPMLAAALVAGLCAEGANVFDAGVLPDAGRRVPRGSRTHCPRRWSRPATTRSPTTASSSSPPAAASSTTATEARIEAELTRVAAAPARPRGDRAATPVGRVAAWPDPEARLSVTTSSAPSGIPSLAGPAGHPRLRQRRRVPRRTARASRSSEPTSRCERRARRREHQRRRAAPPTPAGSRRRSSASSARRRARLRRRRRPRHRRRRARAAGRRRPDAGDHRRWTSRTGTRSRVRPSSPR